MLLRLQEVNALPFAMMTLNCMVWILYGFLIQGEGEWPPPHLRHARGMDVADWAGALALHRTSSCT